MKMSFSGTLRALLRTSLLIALLLASWTPQVLAQEEGGPSQVDRTFDAMVLRPLGAAGVVLGAVILVPAALVSAPGGMESLDNAYDVFLRMPLDNLINAPLGRDFGS